MLVFMRFVDLFCGIGGFHAALDRLGHECVFATDIDKYAAKVYENNWGKPGGFSVHSDIRNIIDKVPPMDIICAGFPCQPFSKSGSQKGFDDQTRGTLFHDICILAEKYKPAVLFLENVPNLVKHDNGNTFSVIQSRLNALGYNFEYSILSPHKFGIPQVRKRVYIVAIRSDLVNNNRFEFPEEMEDLKAPFMGSNVQFTPIPLSILINESSSISFIPSFINSRALKQDFSTRLCILITFLI